MRTVTAKQLIEELKQLPPNAQLAFVSDYGDRVGTQQVHFLQGDIEKKWISENAYSDSGYAVDEEAGSDLTCLDGEHEEVYVIS